jgi:hypothetical protein
MPDLATNLATDTCGSELLPLSPFNSLNYHFGMLLGVDDFETEQAYHRAKIRMHNAWLHREGVVWGFAVTVDDARGEIRVKPGLALDAAGHELHLEAEYCINVGEWFDKHEKDPEFDLVREGFEARVVICFKACLNRQVPAFMEPCDSGGTSTAYSRVSETLEILLLPHRAPALVYPYHRLRQMFGLDKPETLEQTKLDDLKNKEVSPGNTPEDQALLNAVRRDQGVLDEVKRLQALPADQQAEAWLQAFHRFAALDEIDLQPATSKDGARTLLFPGQEDDCVLLADISELTLTKKDNLWLLSGGKVDTSVRPSHVATTTIQDLLCGGLLAPRGPQADADTGPRIDPRSVILLTAKAIMFSVDKDLHDASVKAAAFSVTWFDPTGGWQRANIANASYGGTETKTVVLDLDTAVSRRVRLVVFGTGPTPLLGADLAPLAGVAGGPPGTAHNGHDFVHMEDFVAVVSGPDEENVVQAANQLASAELASAPVPDEAIRPSGPKGKAGRNKSK